MIKSTITALNSYLCKNTHFFYHKRKSSPKEANLLLIGWYFINNDWKKLTPKIPRSEKTKLIKHLVEEIDKDTN